MLSSLAPLALIRTDISKIVFAFLMSQKEVLSKTTSTIVSLRLMRAVAAYSVFDYFPYIESQIQKGRVFAIEGLKCFELILENNKIKEIFLMLARVMSTIIDKTNMTDAIM